MKNVALLIFLMITFIACKTNKTEPVNNSLQTKEITVNAPTISSSSSDVEKKNSCPENMVHIFGEMCVRPLQKCIDWIDDPTLPYARCAEYDPDIECKGSKIHMNFCIDKFEASDDDKMPIADISWTEASEKCSSRGVRLCRESEWTFACEGEDMRPYPYGLQRRSDLCNHDIGRELVCGKMLCDHRKPVNDSSLKDCSTPEGIVNMTGNIDEWVVLDTPHYSQKNGNRKMMSGLKGGWWGNLRNRCRPVTVDHDEYFHELQTGFRCCSDVSLKTTNNL